MVKPFPYCIKASPVSTSQSIEFVSSEADKICRPFEVSLKFFSYFQYFITSGGQRKWSKRIGTDFKTQGQIRKPELKKLVPGNRKIGCQVNWLQYFEFFGFRMELLIGSRFWTSKFEVYFTIIVIMILGQFACKPILESRTHFLRSSFRRKEHSIFKFIRVTFFEPRLETVILAEVIIHLLENSLFFMNSLAIAVYTIRNDNLELYEYLHKALFFTWQN